MEHTRFNECDDDCCALCAAARRPREEKTTADTGPGPEKSGGDGYLHFGSYALPRTRILVFAAALALWLIGFALLSLTDQGTLFQVSWRGFRFLPLIPLLAAYALAGLPVLRNALSNIRRGNALDENFLMS
ncbi:MAG: hypothetical protein LBP93_05900, partial [Treponema sp.]|nr:hypothetical protein [Treponema sp.]